MNKLNFFLIHHPLPQKVIDNFKNVDITHPEIFTQQRSEKRRYFSIQDKKEYSFYDDEMLRELKYSIAKTMGLNYDEYVEVRDSIGINDAGVAIKPHFDIIEHHHISLDDSNKSKIEMYKEWTNLNPDPYSKHPDEIKEYVQMRCNMFIIEPKVGQHAWVEDKVLEIPRGGFGAAFDSGKLHGTTPGSDKKMTISLGYLVRRKTFDDLVVKNTNENVKIYVDTKYMNGEYPG